MGKMHHEPLHFVYFFNEKHTLRPLWLHIDNP